MADEWRACRLADACSSIDYGLTASAADDDVGPYFLRITDIVSGHIDWHAVPHVTADEETVAKYLLRDGDIVLARTGASTGASAYVNQPPPAVFASYLVRLQAKPEFDPRFLAYYLKSDAFWVFIRGVLGDKSAQPNASASTMTQAPLRAPKSRAEQRAIAHILGTLDDKIELNRRMNETLETMARALFRSWFVDFDPVHAKAEGRDPGLPKPIADLSPDSFEDSELGEIPRGWEVGPLGKYFTVGLGGAWGLDKPSAKASAAVRCLRGIDCHDLAEGVLPDVPQRWLSPRQADDRELQEGALLVEGSGSFCGRSLLWHPAYAELIGSRVVYSNFCKRLDPVCTPSQAVACWLQMRRAYSNGEVQAFRTGTAFPNFDVHGALGNLYVVVPPSEVADVFAKFFRTCQRLDLMAQSRVLAALRDTLLPKLISGELRVPDVEGFVERRLS